MYRPILCHLLYSYIHVRYTQLYTKALSLVALLLTSVTVNLCLIQRQLTLIGFFKIITSDQFK